MTEYSPAVVKRAVVGFGRADKHRVQHMVALLLGMTELPEPFDASDALAVAICHVHGCQHATQPAVAAAKASARAARAPRSWRDYKAI